MYLPIQKYVLDRTHEFELIPDERKKNLDALAAFIRKKISEKSPVELVYICIHNSRRSQFGQVAAALAADYYGVSIKSFSGGTVATAFHPNAIKALEEIGFRILSDGQTINPTYEVYFDDKSAVTCFSKEYDHVLNPKSGFAAIMTCGEAEENCPFIPNAAFKINTTYEDPSVSDGTGKEAVIYAERFAQILRENLYTFSQVKK